MTIIIYFQIIMSFNCLIRGLGKFSLNVLVELISLQFQLYLRATDCDKNADNLFM